MINISKFKFILEYDMLSRLHATTSELRAPAICMHQFIGVARYFAVLPATL